MDQTREQVPDIDAGSVFFSEMRFCGAGWKYLSTISQMLILKNQVIG
jgi:hypothetical protein